MKLGSSFVETLMSQSPPLSRERLERELSLTKEHSCSAEERLAAKKQLDHLYFALYLYSKGWIGK